MWLMALLAAAAMAARWWSARSVPQPSANPQWPPFEPPVPAPRPAVIPTVSDAPDPDPAVTAAPEPTNLANLANRAATSIVQATDGALRWVLPIDGECPEGYPVKANDNSGIYHVPGGRFYARTKAERCYVDAGSAAADGYRAAKA